MRFQVIDVEQRTPMWYAARAGRATSSKADAVQAKGKSGAEAATRRNYRIQLVTERLTGTPQEDPFTSAAMQRGIDKEPAARGVYEERTGHLLRQAGFLQMTEHLAGSSPDGYVGDFERIVGFKCPNSATHVDYLRRARLPPEYVWQATHEMWVAGPQAQWYDFVSYDDRLPEGLDFLCVSVARSELEIAVYESEVLRFLSDVETDLEMLLQRLRKRSTAA